ncbi:hypothetical protein [Streptomyces tagetis]|uniref:Uncharacterized protein n=1 Tax=Streptomyces tagetis TaxID=2820809 RepID=A0A941B0B4_9ACTN|nr:hypothetical protein [Streptomyces sp. RG38]MBQ0827140.1 hypothetical protein [Streptomyces sp. RG38]
MSGEALLAAGYVVLLLLVAAGLSLYDRQSTGAWESRVFAGYHRATEQAPESPGPDTWPHSEVHRFHGAVSVSVCVIALVLASAEAVRHHAPAEIALLAAVCLPHGGYLAVLVRRLRRARVSPPR